MEAPHFAEISFVFRTAALTQLAEEELPLSDAMMGHWAAFAWDGDPNHQGERWWPRYRFKLDEDYEGTDEKRLEFDLEITRAAGFETNNCDFFDALLLGTSASADGGGEPQDPD